MARDKKDSNVGQVEVTVVRIRMPDPEDGFESFEVPVFLDNRALVMHFREIKVGFPHTILKNGVRFGPVPSRNWVGCQSPFSIRVIGIVKLSIHASACLSRLGWEGGLSREDVFSKSLRILYGSINLGIINHISFRANSFWENIRKGMLIIDR